MKIKHIYWFSHYDMRSPSTRYRGKYALDLIKKEYGISYSFIYPKRTVPGMVQFLIIFISALFVRKNSSRIVIQKVCSNNLYGKSLKLLTRFRKNSLMYDLDDAEFLRTKPDTLNYFLKHADKVCVGSDELYDYCSKYSERVFINTSPVPVHGLKKTKRNKRIHIGWVGDLGNGNKNAEAFTHKNSLFQQLFPIIKELKIPVEVSIIGIRNQFQKEEITAFFKSSSSVHLNLPLGLNWRDDHWLYSLITSFDIGVAPMNDHPFNKAKSAFKIKQYLSCGVPVIASDVGENSRFIKNHYNGYLYSSNEELKSALFDTINMEAHKYNQMMLNAYRSSNDFTLQKYCEEMINN